MIPSYFFPTHAESPYWIGHDDGMADRPSRVAQLRSLATREQYAAGYTDGQLAEAEQAAERAYNHMESAA